MKKVFIALCMILFTGIMFAGEIPDETYRKSFSFMIPAISISSGCYLYIVVSDRKFNLPAGTTDLLKLNGIPNKMKPNRKGYGSGNFNFEITDIE